MTPAFKVVNYAATPRTETVRASVPFPEGMVTDLARVGVRGTLCAWLPMQTWPDGTVRVAQAQFTEDFAPGETKSYEVGRDVGTLQGGFEPNEWIATLGQTIELGARVTDTFGKRYEASVRLGGRVVQETYLIRVTHQRVYHRCLDGPGIGRDYLTSQFYVTEYRDMPFVVVDWILGNDYLGVDAPNGDPDPNLYPLGGVDVNRAQFLARGDSETQPYLPDLHAITGPEFVDGWTAFTVLTDDTIGDAQTRRYRFLVRVEHQNATDDVKAKWRSTFASAVTDELFALADLDTWQKTEALNLHGGPIKGPTDSATRAVGDYTRWRNTNHFGAWGSFGDVKFSGTTGTPRNTPASEDLVHAIQGDYPRLLLVLQQKAWAQAQRDYHVHGLQVAADQQILLWDMPPIYPGSRDLSRESLGRRALWRNDPYLPYRSRVPLSSNRAHGWNYYDHEHWTTDLLFDYWSVTGDAWAKDEIAHLGQCLRGLMRLSHYATRFIQSVRAEGWTMAGFVQTYLATGDAAIKSYALRRIHEVTDPQRMSSHPSKCFTAQGNYAGTRFPGNHKFYMPWQHGAVLYGYLAAHRFFEDEASLRICEDVVTAVEYAWVTNYRDPVNGQIIPEGLRYYCPIEYEGVPIPPDYWDQDPTIGARWGDSPLGGAHIFLIGGLHMLALWTERSDVRDKALYYGGKLLGSLPPDSAARWSKWRFVIPQDWLEE
jgi:hypothetical protein